MSLSPLHQLDIDNLVLFVGDAVRYDRSLNRLSEHGPTYKTIAASLHTPASFASVFTGLNVPSHGITGFHKVLSSDLPNLLKLPGLNAGLSHKTGTMHEDIHRIFQIDESHPLSDAEEPFIWVVRDPGGHAPYDGYDDETYNQIDETGSEYLNRLAGNEKERRDDYKQSLKSSFKRFEEVIQCIEDRRIENNTLIVYTSDHGELLGEYGFLGHNHIACPELVYVPTTFVHPELDEGIQNQVIRHVDLFPTFMEVLDKNSYTNAVEGGSILNEKEKERIGYNHYETVFYQGFLSGVENRVHSVWDKDGGHVFVESSYFDSLLTYVGIMLFSHNGKEVFANRSFIESLNKFLPGHTRYGNPGFDKEAAKDFIYQFEMDKAESDETQEETQLNNETKQRLKELGYM